MKRYYDEIIVGYSLQRFIVANGKVCGAIIGEELKHDNIRVMLKTTGYKDLFITVCRCHQIV